MEKSADCTERSIFNIFLHVIQDFTLQITHQLIVEKCDQSCLTYPHILITRLWQQNLSPVLINGRGQWAQWSSRTFGHSLNTPVKKGKWTCSWCHSSLTKTTCFCLKWDKSLILFFLERCQSGTTQYANELGL